MKHAPRPRDRRLAAAVLALLPSCWPGAARAADCRLALAAALPLIMADHGNKLLVDVKVDGTPARLIVDTGSEGILLNETVARRAAQEVALGTHLGGLAEIGRGGFALGVGGARSVIRLEVSNLALGRLHGAFSAMATSESFAREGADGLLGMSVLGAFDVDLDVPGQQLRLYSATGNCGKPAVALDEPIYAAHLQEGFHTQVRPLLPVVINGQRFTALLDTGSPRTFLFAGTAARLGLGAAAGPATALKIEGVGGRSTATLRQLDTLAVGPITLRHVTVAVGAEDDSEADLLLGLNFMREVHVWLSNSSHSLVMQFPPAASPAMPGD